MAVSDSSLKIILCLSRITLYRPNYSMTKQGLAAPHISVSDFLDKEKLPEKFNPSGLDLRVGRYIAESDVLTTSLTQEEFFDMNPNDIEYKRNTLFPSRDGRKVYYITTMERLNLSHGLEHIIDARSTTGRVGCMCHEVGGLESGERIIAVQPFAFPITLTSRKTSLVQAAVRYKGTNFMSYEELKEKQDGVRFSMDGKDIFKESLRPDGLVMTFSSRVVYKAKECKEPIDMDAVDEYNPNDYFEVIEGDSKFRMDSRTFYLAGSREVIELGNVCGRISRESNISGTGLWSHFAGIVQAGFVGPLTLECYSLVDRIIKNGDPAGVINLDEIQGKIEELYIGSYQNQTAPKLPKMFKQLVSV